MDILINPFRCTGLDHPDLVAMPAPAADPARTQALLARCPRAAETPLLDLPALAADLAIARLHAKDERARMGLGSFKALGAANVIAHDAEAGRARGRTYIAASAGNHGLSVAAGAAAFGARAIIYLSGTVPEAFADRLRAQGAEVVRAGALYEDSMQAAARAAEAGGGTLLSDSSWPGYADAPHLLMEGYLALMAETVAQMPAPPTHILLQAGVGGLAAAAAAHARRAWGDAPHIAVVEPARAPALQASIAAGAPVPAGGGVSIMGRLDCKEPSLIALKGLARDADSFLTVTEDAARTATDHAAAHGLPSTPSGTAGIAALMALRSMGGPKGGEIGLGAGSRALIILSEGPE